MAETSVKKSAMYLSFSVASGGGGGPASRSEGPPPWDGLLGASKPWEPQQRPDEIPPPVLVLCNIFENRRWLRTCCSFCDLIAVTVSMKWVHSRFSCSVWEQGDLLKKKSEILKRATFTEERRSFIVASHCCQGGVSQILKCCLTSASIAGFILLTSHQNSLARPDDCKTEP